MTVAVGNDGTEPGLQAGRPTTRTRLVYLQRQPLVAAAQFVLFGLALWGITAPNLTGSMTTLIAWSRPHPNPNWVNTYTTYGQPAPWLATHRSVNEREQFNSMRVYVVNPVPPLAMLLIAFNLPLAVVGLFRPHVVSRASRWVVALADAGLYGLLVAMLRDRIPGHPSFLFMEPVADRMTIVLTLLGGGLGFVIGWLFGNPPAPTTGTPE